MGIWMAMLLATASIEQETDVVGLCPGCVPVFYGGLNGSNCFRIPTIIKTSSGTLLAFAENRISDCSDNGGHHDLVLRRSLDNGTSWGPMINVYVGKTPPCPGCPAATSNPNPVEVTMSNGSKSILLHFDTMNNPSPSRHGLDMQMWSMDEGLTWTTPTVISYPPQNNTGSLIGPSVGIQSATGVVYFSCDSNVGHFLYWSKDYGTTWSSSKAVLGLGECSIAILHNASDGEIIMDCRTGDHHRAIAYWSAEGTLIGNVTFPSELIDPNCQGSIINQDGILYSSNANSTRDRVNMAIKKSTDQGKTWSEGYSVWEQASGYSQLVSLGDPATVAVLFEGGYHYPSGIYFKIVDVS
eukprot:m.23462 g.23462  ORF g.23462 m.23462 type:complete len:354 (-) comp7501_c0_seq2:77-1138(-)